MHMEKEHQSAWQYRLHQIIYESDTAAGKAFDVSLLVLIITSIVVVMMDSIGKWHLLNGRLFSAGRIGS